MQLHEGPSHRHYERWHSPVIIQLIKMRVHVAVCICLQVRVRQPLPRDLIVLLQYLVHSHDVLIDEGRELEDGSGCDGVPGVDLPQLF